MRGKSITYENFTVYPEYCGLSYKELQELSSEDDKFHIASLPTLGYNMCVVLQGGKKVASRPKYYPHSSENILPGRTPPIPFKLGNDWVLVLICYEILFPKSYLSQTKPINVILHLVGQPMFSEEQREGWVALQEALAIHFRCPVVCCCGGPEGHMNITGIKEVV